ncbi:dihydrofolate reductase [Halteromyces radiatus]|uniref:dihydrofolate reductase n=1 Tax=Halteromyces radiatus TaxID=101107 RepID=UPI002220FCAA|nr:dihydrofolate reductase [Halteromyces radiatus]KAI8086404.1 dihydrofolate reductase [Halteromyces radiatus]
MTITESSPEIIVVAAALVDSYGIGYQHDLPWRIPGDWNWFQRITTKSYLNPSTNKDETVLEKESDWHNIVIMGRLSWESVPMQRKPLHNRYNIVISSQQEYNIHAVDYWEHATLANTIQEALNQAYSMKKTHGRIFVLGGEQIYRQVIEQPHCTHILLTHIHQQNTNEKIECDSFFPTIDPTHFRLASHDELQEFVQESVPAGLQSHHPFEYEFLLYVRRS